MARKKTNTAETTASSLNKDQREAFDKLTDYIMDKNDDSVYVLKGWAGTGKTYCISMLVKHILENIHGKHAWYKIAVTGPTNKSVRVIKKTSGIKNMRVTFQTIHKLLGLTEKITNDGKQEFVNQGEYKPQINSMRLVIIDEVSMLNDDLFHEILKYRDKIKIICMGDPAQIPPVGRPDCIPFREELAEAYNINTLHLKQIMRQKEGNAIIEASAIIRKELNKDKLSILPISRLNESDEGIEFFNLNCLDSRKKFSETVAKYFNSNEFKNDPEYSKIIAWRNKTVESMNNLVRKSIYGEKAKESKILIGEKLIANSPIIEDGIVIMNTNDEFSVDDFIIKNEEVISIISDHPDAEPYIADFKYYETEVSYYDDQDIKITETINILHEDSEMEFKRAANLLKNRAISNKGRDKSWIAYYNFLRRYADINYGYAITIHKSQGSTYNTAFVLEDDIDVNIDIIERNRIKYTAYTRASKKVYILKRF